MSSTKLGLQFLGHFNGTDGATSFTDDSLYSHTVTNVSTKSSVLNTAVKKFGTAALKSVYTAKLTELGTTPTSIYVTAHGLSSGDKITLKDIYDNPPNYTQVTVNNIIDADHFDVVEDISTSSIGINNTVYYHHAQKVKIDMNGTDEPLKDYFTIRFWFRHDGVYDGLVLGLDLDSYEYTLTAAWPIIGFTQSTSKLVCGTLTQSGTLTADTWYFVEWAVTPTNQYLFIDGTLDTSGTLSGAYNYSSYELIHLFSKAYAFNGSAYIDDLQIWLGTCLHTSSYTAPVAEYSDASDIKISSLNLDTEFTIKDVKVVSLNLDVEIKTLDVKVVSLNLQVEIPEYATVTTSPATSVDITTVTFNGIFYWGLSAVVEMGFVYATTSSPTTADTKVVITTDSGALTSNITGLTANTTYYYRAFLTDGVDTYYGADESFTTLVPSSIVPSITPIIQILDYLYTLTATASTTSATLLLDGVTTLAEDDFIVNTTRDNTSRRIDDIPTAGIFTLNATIPNQAQDDIIRCYKFMDHSDLIKQETISYNDKIQGGGDLAFRMVTDGTYVPRAGQYIRLFLNDSLYFTGMINTVTRQLPQNGITEKIFFDLTATQLKIVPPRRTITVNYDIDTTCSTIVTDVINNYLVDEGFMAGTINDGVKLSDQWLDDCISIGDVLDQCANLSGFQWYIDENFDVQFMQDPTTVTTCTYAITDLTNTFTDFRNVTVEETIDNYNNKIFIAGGNDQNGNLVIVGQTTTASVLEMQDYAAGSGVWGRVERNSSTNQGDYEVAEAGTTESTIVLGTATMASHSITVGDEVYNITQGYRSTVASVTVTSFDIVTAITGQTAGNTIVIYDNANKIARNILKRQDQIPKRIAFETYSLGFRAGQELQVALSTLSMSTTQSYIVEEVNIGHIASDYFKSTVRAILRNSDNISTQKNPDAWDFYKNIGASATKRAGYGPQRGAINPKVTVSSITPSIPKINDIFIRTTPTPSTTFWYNGTTWQE